MGSPRHSVGLIEAVGLVSAIEAADTALKSADVRLIGYEYSGFDARIVVKIEGDISAVKAAVSAACVATKTVSGSVHGYDSAVSEGALREEVYDRMVNNVLTVGTPLQAASGKRPQGTAKTAKWVGQWKREGTYIYE